MNRPTLPEGLTYVRTTDDFTPDTAPGGLRRAHRVADGVWGQLVVRSGSVVFVFEDQADQPFPVTAGEKVPIPPSRLHHVEMPDPAATFAIEFYSIPQTLRMPGFGRESTGLED